VADVLPSFDEVRQLIGSPKPPLGCRVVELREGEVQRSARVLFDGLASWFVDDGSRVEVRGTHDRALFDEGGRLERVGPGLGNVHSNGWVKTVIDGRRMANLDKATGRVLGREVIDGRNRILVECSGLKSNDDVVFRMHIDAETGVVVRVSRPDLGLVLRVEDLRIGTAQEQGREG